MIIKWTQMVTEIPKTIYLVKKKTSLLSEFLIFNIIEEYLIYFSNFFFI